ncbi:MAG: DUF3284 domain-containing protein [Mycoplasmatales bacterium]
MAKIRKREFQGTSEQVYKVIANMLRENALAYNKKITKRTKLTNIAYSYGDNNIISVEVTDAKEFELIEYFTIYNDAEKFIVSFNISDLDNSKTLLSYSSNLITNTKKMEYNYKLMSFIYAYRQRKAFKHMCNYIEQKLKGE